MPAITFPFLRSVNTTVSVEFNRFMEAYPATWQRVAMTAESGGAENAYPRLDQIAGLREWVGDRVVHELSLTNYTIVNKTFENTIAARREDFEDDKFGFLAIAAGELGNQAAEMPDRLIWNLCRQGNAQTCFDGQYFFDTDHPGWDADGKPTTISNFQDGSGPAWYLFDTTRVLKPMIFQRRRPFVITPLVKLDDPNVFNQNRFVWGVDGRCNAGYGMWQLAYMSKAPLTPANYAAARAAMGAIRRKDGMAYGITPNLLVVPPSLEADALRITNGEYIANGAGGFESNPWKGTAETLRVPYLG